MSVRKISIWLVLIVFSLLCAWAVTKQGYLALWTIPFDQPVTIAIGIDLLIVLILGCMWMIKDAALKGRNVLPYVVLTATCGSIGLLLYLALASEQSSNSQVVGNSRC